MEPIVPSQRIKNEILGFNAARAKVLFKYTLAMVLAMIFSVIYPGPLAPGYASYIPLNMQTLQVCIGYDLWRI